VVTGTSTPTSNNGDRFVNDADLRAMQGALRSRLGMANYRYDLDFNGDNTVDTSDYYLFLQRYKTFMDSNGNVTQL